MNKDKEEQEQSARFVLCNLCGKRAESICGRCQEIGYCKPEHQKADWPAHKRKCISMAQKAKNHNEKKYELRALVVQHIAMNKYFQASDYAYKLLEQERKFCESNPSFQNELDYGSSVVILTRIWIYFKDFNKALDVLNNYLQSKMAFIKDVNNLPKFNNDQSDQSLTIKLIQEKMSLISAIASVSHELVRNAMDILEILIDHIEKIYGPSSLELSSIYFYIGNYLYFLNQPNKAFACFLKSAKLRGQKCCTAYYNAGLICMFSKQFSLSLDMLILALNTLTESQRSKFPYLEIQIYESLAFIYKHLNNASKTIASLQKASCLRENMDTQTDDDIMQRNLCLLAVIKRQMQMQQSELKHTFPRQKNTIKRFVQINNQNYRNVLLVDKIDQNQDVENQEWIQSFNQFKKRLNVISQIPQVPFVAGQKLLGKDKPEFIRQQEIPSFVKNKDKFSQQKVNVSLELVAKLTSNEMDFLNELNRLLSECKQKSAIIDIFQNSNLYQTIGREKLSMIYQLNPQFKRSRDMNSKKMELMNDSGYANESFSKQYLKKPEKVPKKNKVVTPRLNLQKVRKNFP